ncbi:MAG: hypothetical protein PHQ91_08250 [Thermoanaerobaculaceae bacterium]|nr:hypothetical protein [Thermoanaerobaculaceae bacterium]TAM49938.1 MAG: hypothetical protein EPN53_07900 [Acidobacteriota bacterium]
MGKTLRLLAAVLLLTAPASAQAPSFRDQLLDRLIGSWVLHGTIAGKETTHDVVAEWVLAHQYVRLHEVSRERNGRGQAEYEALVFLGWDRPSSRYACLWLDSTGGGGLSAQAIAYAARRGDEIPFLFKAADGSLFHTTFAYSRSTDSWTWVMDGEEGGKLQPFARVTLKRR